MSKKIVIECCAKCPNNKKVLSKYSKCIYLQAEIEDEDKILENCPLDDD